MEFQHEERVSDVQDIGEDLIAFSDDEETLSFCDFLLYDSEGSVSTHTVSNPNSPDLQDFSFSVNFGGYDSPATETFAADDPIFDGSLLPRSRFSSNGSESVRQNEKLQDRRSDSFEKNEILLNEKLQDRRSDSFGKNEILLNEKLEGWRSDSLESSSSYWSRSFNYSVSHDKALRSVHSSAVKNKCNAKMANHTSFSSTYRSKKSSAWLQLCSLRIKRAPVMEVENLRLRQYKRNGNEDTPIVNRKTTTFHKISKSVKENKGAMETRQIKSSMSFALFTPLISCKSSTDSVIDCTRKKSGVKGNV